MPKETLRKNLKDLQTELSSAEQKLDTELHTLLRGVAEDIEHLLGDEPAAPRSGKEQLEEIALKFESDHPRLASIVGEVADTISKMGI